MQSPTFPTPNISHLNTKDYDQVYEPAEDSFLLLDSLEKEVEYLNKLRPSICLEVGSGSGVCLTFLAQILKHQAYFIATDINPYAAGITRKTGQVNGVQIDSVITDLVSSVIDRLEHQVDVLLFNPPYVVTPSSEVGSVDIVASWAGGVKGREVTDRLLPNVDRLLSDRGVMYLVIIKENDQDEIHTIVGKSKFNCDIVMSRKSGPEKLSILKFTRI